MRVSKIYKKLDNIAQPVSEIQHMTPTLNKYTDNSGYYIQARPPEVGHVTYQVTPQTEEFITELGYSDSEELPWGLINPLKESGEIYTHGTGVEDQKSAPELSPGSLPELSEDEADALIGYLEGATEVNSDIVDQVRQKIDSEASEQNMSHLLELIEENIELPSPNGNDWEITYERSTESQMKLIAFERAKDMGQAYAFERDDDSEHYVLSHIMMRGNGYDDRLGIALSHQRIILNCLSQLSEKLDSHDMILSEYEFLSEVNTKMLFDWE